MDEHEKFMDLGQHYLSAQGLANQQETQQHCARPRVGQADDRELLLGCFRWEEEGGGRREEGGRGAPLQGPA